MNTEVAISNKGQAVVPLRQGANTFEGDSSDILLPRVYVAQKTSKAVEDGKTVFGQIVRSTTGEILGGLGKPFPFIPLKHWKTSMITQGGKYVRLEPWTAQSGSLPYEFEDKGIKYKRERVLNFYVLLPADVAANMVARKTIAETGEMPDKLVSLVPCQIGFKSTSYKAGRTLVSHFAQMEDLGATPYMRWLTLDSEIQANDKGKFAVLIVGDGGAVKDKDQLMVAEKWAALMRTATLKVDDKGLDDETIEVADVREEF